MCVDRFIHGEISHLVMATLPKATTTTTTINYGFRYLLTIGIHNEMKKENFKKTDIYSTLHSGAVIELIMQRKYRMHD